nr:hypothetical protein [uncultured Albidiferax sp.]
MNILPLASLHKHFLAADAVKQLLFTKIPDSSSKFNLAPELQEAAQQFSSMLRLQVFYALIYVVVEGYKELACQDAEVDRLLGNAEFVDSLRRFRNANFHFQEDPFSPKLVDFLHAEGSEDWVRALYFALDNFFTEKLKLNEVIASLQATTRH